MIYISYSDSKDSLNDFLQEYTESTSGGFRGKGIIGQMEDHSIKSDWCSLHCPVTFESKVFKRQWKNRCVSLERRKSDRYMDYRDMVEFTKMLENSKKVNL